MVSAFGNSPLFVSSLSSLSAAFLLDFSETHLEIEYYVIFFCHIYLHYSRIYERKMQRVCNKGLYRKADFNFQMFAL